MQHVDIASLAQLSSAAIEKQNSFAFSGLTIYLAKIWL